METLTTPLALALLCALPLTTACRELRFDPADRTPSETDPSLDPDPEATPAPSFAKLAVTGDRSCAIDADGRVLCWGLDLMSQEWGSPILAPKVVPGVEGATRVALSEAYACAQVDAGLSCWGATPLATVEDFQAVPQEPFVLAGSSDVIDFALAPGRVCAVLASGGVRCWGVMTDPGDCFEPDSAVVEAFDLPEVATATTVAVSGSATCFTRADASSSCYLGLTGELFELPFGDAKRLDVTQSDGCFSAHASFCAVTGDGAVDCMDAFFVDDLGPITRIHEASPPAAELVWRAEPGEYCVATAGGGLWCAAAPGGTVIDAEQVAMSHTHACALSAGVISCWGSNEWGALGISTPARRVEAEIVAGLSDVTTVAAGADHSCATTASGEVRCWGSNHTRQRGWESTAMPTTYHPRWDWFPEELSVLPQAVPGLSTANAVFADNYRSCASEVDGSVVCWGQDMTATMSLQSPTAIPNVSQASSVTTGDDSESCAVIANGAVKCWGRGWYGARVGVETLSLPSAALKVDGDTYSACALLQTGEVYCWGGNVQGSIGNSGDPLAPQKVAGIEDAIDLSESCAVTAAHELVCWAFPWQPGLVENGVATTVAMGVRRVDGPCVVRLGGQAACFASLGDIEPMIDALVDVPGAGAAAEVVAGSSHGCVLREDGRVACWGWAAAGRLGDGSRTVFTEPQPIVSALDD